MKICSKIKGKNCPKTFFVRNRHLDVLLASDSRDLELELDTRSRSDDRIGDTEQPPAITSWQANRVVRWGCEQVTHS
jgi:hypothetical protein